jgi:3-oxoacyl-[acyl-carrier protein] reductase
MIFSLSTLLWVLCIISHGSRSLAVSHKIDDGRVDGIVCRQNHRSSYSNNNNFKDKVVIITGASKGIGKSIAINFACEGAKLVLVARNMSALVELKEEMMQLLNHHHRMSNSSSSDEICSNNMSDDTNNNNCHDFTSDLNADNIIVMKGDVSSERDMNDMVVLAVHSFGRVDVLIHNAGIYPHVRFEEMSLSDWSHVIDINLTGTFITVKACVEVMKHQVHGGKIVLISSISGPQTGLPGFAHYTASKSGMNGFMKTIAIEVAKYHININAIEPGNILTEGYDVLDVEHIDNMLKAIPLGRLGQPQDIASAALFLASSDANYITGQSLIIDGGQTLPESHYSKY